MKLKLIFPDWKDVSEKYFITIHRNKINDYIGLYPLTSEHGVEKLNSKKFINSKFEISKLDKLDRKELKTEATHKIFSQELHNVVQGYNYCVKLNFFQEIYIKWFQKKYIIQSLEFKKSILSGLIGSIIGALITIAFQNKQNVKIEHTKAANKKTHCLKSANFKHE